MTNWLRSDYLAITLIILLALAVVFVPSVLRAEPATPDAPISENCEQVATVGLLDVFFCESDFGNFYVNSFGFMMSEY